MSKKGAGYRLRKELLAINKDRPEFIWATHKETNILLWSFLSRPPATTRSTAAATTGVELRSPKIIRLRRPAFNL